MIKLLNSQLCYYNSRLSFYKAFLIIFALFYFFTYIDNITVPEKTILILFNIIPVFVTTYILSVIYAIAVDHFEKRAKLVMLLPLRKRDISMATVALPLSKVFFLVVTGYVIFTILNFPDVRTLLPNLHLQLRVFDNNAHMLILLTFLFQLASSRPGQFIQCAMIGITIVILVVPGMAAYYNTQFVQAWKIVKTPEGALALSAVCGLIIYYANATRIYWDSINYHLTNIYFIVKGELQYFGSQVRIRNQIIILAVVAFLFIWIVELDSNGYYGFGYFIFLPLLISIVLIFIFNNIRLLVLEITEKRAKYLSHLPIKQTSLAFARVVTPYAMYLVFIIAFALLFIATSYSADDYYRSSYGHYDPGLYEPIAIICSVFLISIFILRLFSEVPGRYLFVIIGLYFAVGSVMMTSYPWHDIRYLNNILLSSFITSIDFLYEFVQTFTGSVFMSSILTAFLYFSFRNRRSYLK